MKNKKLNELNTPKNRPSIEEQIAFVEELSRRVDSHIEKMKKDNPDVIEWINLGRPHL
jgi:ribosomal protein S15P/S13E